MLLCIVCFFLLFSLFGSFARVLSVVFCDCRVFFFVFCHFLLLICPAYFVFLMNFIYLLLLNIKITVLLLAKMDKRLQKVLPVNEEPDFMAAK